MSKPFQVVNTFQALPRHFPKTKEMSSHMIDTQTFVISNGSEKNWINLTKHELLTIPWIKEAVNTPNSKFVINDCLGFEIKEITDAGAIHLALDYRLLRISKNISNPVQLRLTEMYLTPEGVWEVTPDGPQDIHSAYTTTIFGTLHDGFRMFVKEGKKYNYN
jgi:hypothetical protein